MMTYRFRQPYYERRWPSPAYCTLRLHILYINNTNKQNVINVINIDQRYDRCCVSVCYVFIQ